MTQARVRFSNFEEYLSYSDKTPLEGRYLLIDGELVELPPESEPNNWIANHLQFLLVAAKVAPLRLIENSLSGAASSCAPSRRCCESFIPTWWFCGKNTWP